jgi:tRNA 2-thiouridine synthesizing protein A
MTVAFARSIPREMAAPGTLPRVKVSLLTCGPARAYSAGRDPPMTERLDIRGKVCPYPTTEVLDSLKRLPEDATLEVVSDYPPARFTIPYLVDDLGYPWELRDNPDGTFTITIRKVRAAKGA